MTRRFIPAVAISAALIATGLTGCSSTPSDPACISVSSGAASDAVKVSGDFGGKATISVPETLTTTKLQRTIVTKGTGEMPKTGQTLDAMVSFYAGTTSSDPIQAKVAQLPSGDSRLTDALRAGLDCLAVGTRSAIVVPATDMLTADEITSLGLAEGEPMIVVIDIIDIVPEPTVSEWTDGLPKISTPDSGIPSIDLAGVTKPEGIAVAVLKSGDGETVKPTDTVKVHYLGVFWSDGVAFDGNYGQDATDLTLTAVIPGFKAGLVGQKVGSQVLVSIPAKSAYGEGTPSDQNPMVGQDLLFLIDIEAITPAK
ncbi:MAG TPA: FKBP-type peptidyl-prolyl cis-trans isomerase [Microbacteriaceae bacterium]|nr:FKBP-type peptidyl-prolyl cis-trans isomerase [Microbacteriaceae bacterium]